MKQYDHKRIEKKWQELWAKNNLYHAEENSKKEKRYILDMYPYPSGDGLHVGHVEGYTATDIYSRFKRMQGFNVLHPMGWDAFGLPAENYAVKTGIHPRETTAKAIKNFTRQIKSLGLSYDWTREVGTHAPEYYKWTQWFFLLLYKNGLAYKKEAPVNWDPVDQTVLADEQVLPDGTAERSGAQVEKRSMSQWFFKITDYADALVDDLDSVDWPESTVTNQRNWIGRSEGAVLEFGIKNQESGIKVFTTRPDTLFGATYMVLAPEHELVQKILDERNKELRISNKDEVLRYIVAAREKTEIERTAEGKEKTGVELKGIKAINPGNKEEIPIFIADYVLAHYGTGAIMAVPAHDKRDFAFAEYYNLTHRVVVLPLYVGSGVRAWMTETGFSGSEKVALKELGDGVKKGESVYWHRGTLLNSGEFDGMTSDDATEVIIKKFGKKKITYKLRDWLISRQRYWGAPIPIVYDPEGRPHPVPEKHLPWLLPDDVDFEPKGYAPLSRSKELKERTESIFGKGWTPEVDTMDTFVCSSWYFFRFTDPHNEKEFASKAQVKKWLPVDLYMGGAEHTVLHLMYARFFTKVLQKLGHISFGEPFTKLRHQGTVLAEDGRKMSKSLGNVINPNDVVETYGADTLRLYEMFMGPLEDTKPWNTQNILGPRRFLEKVWRLQERLASDSAQLFKDVETLVHQTIKKVGDDIEALKFNTAVSQLMIMTGELEKQEAVTREAYETLVRLLAPFAPHLSEEIWESLGHSSSIHLEPWPKYDSVKVQRGAVTIAVQVDGKVRGALEMPVGSSEKVVRVAAEKIPSVSKWLHKKKVTKVIYITDRLLNFVTG